MFRVSQKTEYALRAMVELAIRPQEERVPARVVPLPFYKRTQG